MNGIYDLTILKTQGKKKYNPIVTFISSHILTSQWLSGPSPAQSHSFEQ